METAAKQAQTLTGQGSTAVTNSTDRYYDNGSDPQLLQRENQLTITAMPAAISGAEPPTEAEFLALRTVVDDIRTAVINAGIARSA